MLYIANGINSPSLIAELLTTDFEKSILLVEWIWWLFLRITWQTVKLRGERSTWLFDVPLEHARTHIWVTPAYSKRAVWSEPLLAAWIFYVKFLTEHSFEFLNLKWGCTGSPLSFHVRCRSSKNVHFRSDNTTVSDGISSPSSWNNATHIRCSTFNR